MATSTSKWQLAKHLLLCHTGQGTKSSRLPQSLICTLARKQNPNLYVIFPYLALDLNKALLLLQSPASLMKTNSKIKTTAFCCKGHCAVSSCSHCWRVLKVYNMNMKAAIKSFVVVFIPLLGLDVLLCNTVGWITAAVFPVGPMCQLKFGCKHKIQTIFTSTTVKMLPLQLKPKGFTWYTASRNPEPYCLKYPVTSTFVG